MTGNVKKITTQNQRCEADSPESHTMTLMQIAESPRLFSFKTLSSTVETYYVTIPEGEKNEQEAWPHLA